MTAPATGQPLRRWLLLGVAALLGIAGLAAAAGNGVVPKYVAPTGPRWITISPTATATNPTPTPPSDVGPGGPPGVLSGVVLLVVGLLVGAALVATLVVALRAGGVIRVRRPAPADPAPDEDEDEEPRDVRAAVDAGLADLAADGGDPRAALLACWSRLEAAADAAGVPRARADTPTDLVGRLLAGYRVPAPALDRLAELYRRARYAPHVVDAAMRAEGVAALGAVRDALRAPARASAPDTGPGAADA